MPLPNPGMNFTPYDQLPASDLNNFVENIEALADGSGFDAGAIGGEDIDADTIEQTNLKEKLTEYSFDFVASGCVWTGDAYGSTRVASMTAGVVYIDGVRISVSAVTSRTFTASRDTYIDVGADGVVDYNEVTNNAASPALASGHIRIGIIVTGASNILNVGSINQGEENKVLPIASSIPYQVTDSLGNLICPRDPNRRILGYRQITSNPATATTEAQIIGLSSTVIVPENRKIKVTVHSGQYIYNTGTTSNAAMGIWSGVVNSGTRLAFAYTTAAIANAGSAPQVVAIASLASGVRTLNASLAAIGGTAAQLVCGSTNPAFILVELV